MPGTAEEIQRLNKHLEQQSALRRLVRELHDERDKEPVKPVRPVRPATPPRPVTPPSTEIPQNPATSA